MHADSADTETIWTLLRKHVPEVASGVVKVLRIVREAGRRSALAVASNHDWIDPVRAVSGDKGERAKRMVGELGGEKIDIIRWEESAEQFTSNVLAPWRIVQASFDDATREANVTVAQLSGSLLPDFRLRSELLMNLTGWKLHVEVKHAD